MECLVGHCCLQFTPFNWNVSLNRFDVIYALFYTFYACFTKLAYNEEPNFLLLTPSILQLHK